jgi:hypothetical protein
MMCLTTDQNDNLGIFSVFSWYFLGMSARD